MRVGLVPLLAGGLALAIGGVALTLPPPLTGRLEPGLVPGLMALMAIVAVAYVIWRPGTGVEGQEPANLRAIVALALAIPILAFGVRPAGVLLASFAAGLVAANGVAGVSPRRAVLIGLGISAAISAMLAFVFRQPLPILPPGFW